MLLQVQKLLGVFSTVCVVIAGCGVDPNKGNDRAHLAAASSSVVTKNMSVRRGIKQTTKQTPPTNTVQNSPKTHHNSKMPETKQTPEQASEVNAVKNALRIYRSKKMQEAEQAFARVQKKYPNNAVAAHYLGLIALQAGNHALTIKQWNRYVKLDPKDARENQIPSQLALLEQEALNSDVKNMLDNENKLNQQPAEPNSIAVFTFNNRGDDKYAVFAKGITALVITDLAQVPGLKVLERQKISKVLSELKLSKSGLVSEDTKVRAGKLMKAEKLIMGDFAVK